LKSLISVPNIEQEIRDRNYKIKEAEIKHVAEKISRIALKLFATLIFMKKGAEICALLRDGVSDDDLPFRRDKDGEGNSVLQRCSGGSIEAFDSWSEEDIEAFDRMQWWVIAPVFKINEHHDLVNNTVLPFIPFETNGDAGQKREGGYSEVYAVQIHPSHHNFWEQLESMAREYSSHFVLS